MKREERHKITMQYGSVQSQRAKERKEERAWVNVTVLLLIDYSDYAYFRWLSIYALSYIVIAIV